MTGNRSFANLFCILFAAVLAVMGSPATSLSAEPLAIDSTATGAIAPVGDNPDGEGASGGSASGEEKIGDKPGRGESSDGSAKPTSLPSATKGVRPKYVTKSLRGKVVWFAKALEQQYGIRSDPDFAPAMVALQTPRGKLYPIVKDMLGRGFGIDHRMRNIPMELKVRQFQGSPVVQVIRVYVIKPDGKYLFDYWCDICAIPMFELKECECCQGPIRIRERLVEKFTPKRSGEQSGEIPAN